jgi:hypothetical protein
MIDKQGSLTEMAKFRKNKEETYSEYNRNLFSFLHLLARFERKSCLCVGLFSI